MKQSKISCPICGQYNMEFYATTYRSHPFIDGKTYPKMCFGCAHTPKEYEQTYDKKGEILEEFGPFFDHKHLATAQELFEQGSTETLAEAQRCISGVRRRIKEVGAVALKKLRLKQPPQTYDCDWDDAKPKANKPEKKTRKKRVSTEQPESTPVKKARRKKSKPVKRSLTGGAMKLGAKKPERP